MKIATVTEESTKFERSLRSLGSPAAASGTPSFLVPNFALALSFSLSLPLCCL